MYLDRLKVTCSIPTRGVGVTVSRKTIREGHYVRMRRNSTLLTTEHLKLIFERPLPVSSCYQTECPSPLRNQTKRPVDFTLLVVCPMKTHVKTDGSDRRGRASGNSTCPTSGGSSPHVNQLLQKLNVTCIPVMTSLLSSQRKRRMVSYTYDSPPKPLHVVIPCRARYTTQHQQITQ